MSIMNRNQLTDMRLSPPGSFVLPKAYQSTKISFWLNDCNLTLAIRTSFRTGAAPPTVTKTSTSDSWYREASHGSRPDQR